MNVYELIAQKALELIDSYGITDDREEYEENDELYLVDDVGEVKAALKEDIERLFRESDYADYYDWDGVQSYQGTRTFNEHYKELTSDSDEDVATFLDRNGIKWE